MQSKPVGTAATKPVAAPDPISGIVTSAAAFLIWGLSSVYWKCLTGVPATEIILHRILWSFLLMVPLLALLHSWGSFTRAITHPPTLGFIQYLGPTGMFLLGILAYGEPFSQIQAITFALIWAALCIFTADMVVQHRKKITSSSAP